MIPDAIYDAAPSVKTVWCAAAAAEASTFSQRELREATRLNRDTVRQALQHLEKVGLAAAAARDYEDLRVKQ